MTSALRRLPLGVLAVCVASCGGDSSADYGAALPDLARLTDAASRKLDLLGDAAGATDDSSVPTDDAAMPGDDLGSPPDLAGPARDLSLGHDLAIAAMYPAGPYGNTVGDTIPPLLWEGYVDDAGDAVATQKPYGDYSMDQLRKSGRAYAMIHVSAFW